jgi:two-component system chemotaxis response regulator CheY
MKILVVDDSAVMRKLITRAIRQAGFGDAQVVEAEDGRQAITVVEEESPHLILADWNMPNLTGIEMLKALRAKGDNTVVGFVTSESSVEIRREAQAAGASFFLSKPIDTDKLSAAIGTLTGG